MDSPPLTGRNRVQAALLLLVTALVVTSGCVGLLDDPGESSAETPTTPQPDQSGSDIDEQSDTADAASVETQATDEETPSDSDEDGTDDSDRSAESAGSASATDAGSDSGPLLSYVPASADAIVTVDPSILTHESTIALANGSESTYEWNYSDLDPANHSLFDSSADPVEVSSYQETIALYETQLGINVSDVQSVTIASETGIQSGTATDNGSVAILDTDLSWATVRDALAQSDTIDSEFEEASYEGVPLYRVPKTEAASDSAFDSSHERSYDKEIWVADFENGVFAVGPRDQVTAVIDTKQGAAPAVEGSLRAEAANVEGLVTAVTNVSIEQNSDERVGVNRPWSTVETIVLEYAPEGETIRVNADFIAADSDGAREVQSVLGFVLNSHQWTDDPEQAAIIEAFADATEVSIEDNRVHVSFEMGAQRLVELTERLKEGN